MNNGTPGTGNGRVFLYRREQSQELGELFQALSKAKKSFKPVRKNAKAQYGMFANLLAMVEATQDALSDQGLVINQTFHWDTELLLVTELGHGPSGQFIRSVLPIKQGAKAQDTKGYITYMRRAGYEAILGLAAEEDDDGATANQVQANGPDVNWGREEQLAAEAIQNATTAARLTTILQKVALKVASGDMDPHCVGKLEQLADKKKATLKAAPEATK